MHFMTFWSRIRSQTITKSGNPFTIFLFVDIINCLSGAVCYF